MPPTSPNDLLDEITKGAELDRPDRADEALPRAKIEQAIRSGRMVDALIEVQPPKEGVSDAVKQAYLEDQKEKTK